MLPPIEYRIAEQLGVPPRQVMAAVQLLDDGATVPFISRYRKEATGGLDDTQMRTIEERLGYLRELEDRRATVIASIDEQGKLDPALRSEIESADTKQRLEDLYLPYKPKRRTKAQIAREAGIAPLAEALLADPTLDPELAAAPYLNPEAGFAEIKAVLDGARQILMEQFAEDATLLGELRTYLHDYGQVRSAVIEGKENEGAKFRDWFDFHEPIATMPSHRALAMLRGRNEGVLRISLDVDRPDPDAAHPCEGRIAARFGIRNQGRPADRWLADTVRWTWSVKISVHLELDLMGKLREKAEEEAIHVFARNLKDLLLAAP
ncbi:MAG: RNA-binding transcriptional accessory protein, partial [Betaproteobacteria bacterium HGW-Betaproteobacteria-21]